MTNLTTVLPGKSKVNICRINLLVQKPKFDESSSSLAIVGRYILTLDIFDKIRQTESVLTAKSN